MRMSLYQQNMEKLNHMVAICQNMIDLINKNITQESVYDWYNFIEEILTILTNFCAINNVMVLE